MAEYIDEAFSCTASFHDMLVKSVHMNISKLIFPLDLPNIKFEILVFFSRELLEQLLKVWDIKSRQIWKYVNSHITNQIERRE